MMEQPLPDLQSAKREVVFLPFVLGNAPTKKSWQWKGPAFILSLMKTLNID